MKRRKSKVWLLGRKFYVTSCICKLNFWHHPSKRTELQSCLFFAMMKTISFQNIISNFITKLNIMCRSFLGRSLYRCDWIDESKQPKNSQFACGEILQCCSVHVPRCTASLPTVVVHELQQCHVTQLFCCAEVQRHLAALGENLNSNIRPVRIYLKTFIRNKMDAKVI